MALSKKNIIIGTAQFGARYSISSINAVNYIEADKILKKAYKNNINHLDTAINYFKAYNVLKKINVSNWNIITKFPELKLIKNSQNQYRDYADNVLKDFKIKKIKCVHFHNINQLFSSNGDQLFRMLKDLKDKKVISQIGASVYFPEEVDKLLKNYDFDVIQCPVNIFDRDFIIKKTLKKIKKRNIKVHVRSIFLQGLLLMEKEKLPKYFEKWYNIFDIWYQYLAENKISAIDACISFIKNQKDIDKIIIGMDSVNHLNQILKAFKSKRVINNFNLRVNNKYLLKPSLWRN